MIKTSQNVPPETTNWYVITGAPCSGKSAVIRALAYRGFKVVHEAARAYIDSQLALGYSLREIKTDILAFERHILLEKVRVEQSLPRNTVHFLDRAIPDSVAYFQLEGLDPEEPMSYSHTLRYKGIFVLDRLMFEADEVRTEDNELAGKIEMLLEKCYRKLGYTLIRVPVMPVEQRAEWVLKHTRVH